MSPSTSPDRLLLAKTVQGAGVRRLNKLPLLILLAVAIAVISAMVYAVYERGHRLQLAAKDQAYQAQDSTSVLRALLDGRPQGYIEAEAPAPPGAARTEPAADRPPAPPAPPEVSKGVQPDRPASDAWRQFLQKQQALYEHAIQAPTRVEVGDTLPGAAQSANAAASTDRLQATVRGALEALGQSGAGAPDPNLQGRKEAFLEKADLSGYLPHRRQSPVSPYEIKTGTVIPAIITTGIHSDLPGQLIAQVSQDVYDTATGRYRLIPQGTRLVGGYDSRVAFGQRRVLVVWHRLVFPDASTLELDAMPGADQAGYAGFKDQVDNHTIRTFASAILWSVISAGYQLSQPDRGTDESLTAQEILAASLGREMGRIGGEITRRHLNVQPTLAIRPGYRFVVMVAKDMVLEPWP
jgi:type IV secretion system protein VirB10